MLLGCLQFIKQVVFLFSVLMFIYSFILYCFVMLSSDSVIPSFVLFVKFSIITRTVKSFSDVDVCAW